MFSLKLLLIIAENYLGATVNISSESQAMKMHAALHRKQTIGIFVTNFRNYEYKCKDLKQVPLPYLFHSIF